MRPRHSVPRADRKMNPVGIEMSSVESEKNGRRSAFMPVTNRWCCHTKKLRSPDPEHPRDREAVAPQRLAGEHRQQLEHDPEAGEREHVDLGMPEHPEQVLEQIGAPALAGDEEGRLSVRSIAAISSVAISVGAASSISPEVASTDHTKIGRRDQVMPGARIVTIVAIRLKPSSVIERPTSAKKPM